MRGTVTKKGNRFYPVYDLGKDSSGKRMQKWGPGFAYKKDAEKYLREKITELESSIAVQHERCELGVYLRGWLESYGKTQLALNTYNGYRVNIENHIIPAIGKVRLCDLKPENIQKLYAKLQEDGLSSTTVLYVHRVLRKSLNTAVKERKIPYNVTDYVYPPKKAKFRPSVLQSDEILRLLESSKGTDAFIPVLLAVTLGLRRGEALGLRWEDINFENNTLLVERTATYCKEHLIYSDVKTKNSYRTLQLPQHVADFLKEHENKQQEAAKCIGSGYNSDHLVNYRADGTPLTTNELQKLFKHALEAAGLPDIRFHDLRHTNATLMLQNQVPAKIVSSMLGHSGIGITLDIYSHVITEMQQPATNVIDRLLKQKEENGIILKR